jgi:peptide/nickel transport system ATP-binding protein
MVRQVGHDTHTAGGGCATGVPASQAGAAVQCPRVLLRIENLQTHFDTPAGVLRAVDGVSLAIAPAQTLALVGESGCGKSLTALSILRLVPPPGRIAGGHVWFDDRDLLALPEREMRAMRGNRMAMIFQEPMTSLNPLLRIGPQIDESLRLHRWSSARAARQRTVELLRRVGLPAPEQRRRDYPHQLSGGMRQRVMIAMALACGPELLIADEPTTALDATIQAQILALLHELQRQSGLALLFITHDLAVVAQIADVVCVMYAGRIVEQAPVTELFAQPRHPYTQALLRSTPRAKRCQEPFVRSTLRAAPRQKVPDTFFLADTFLHAGRLPVIPGDVPRAGQRPTGCPFHPRCELGRADAQCNSEEPPLRAVGAAHTCACWKA